MYWNKVPIAVTSELRTANKPCAMRNGAKLTASALNVLAVVYMVVKTGNRNLLDRYFYAKIFRYSPHVSNFLVAVSSKK